ncbi:MULTISPECIES: hypothetical protein [unclassified Microbulbifer]|nr:MULTISPECIES: hypothetical protein [unclassified Microbulbifer]
MNWLTFMVDRSAIKVNSEHDKMADFRIESLRQKRILRKRQFR